MEKVKTPPRAVNKKAQKAKDKVEPVDAEVVSEDKKTEDTHEEFRKSAEETVKEEGGSEHVKSTADINLEENKEEQDSAKVNFMDDDYMASMLKKKTEKSEEKKEGEEKTETTSENKATPAGESTDAGAFTKDDMQDFAEVFMDILDMGISTALKFYSKDTSTTAYELGLDKKKRLVRQLTNLFMKYQMKFSLEFMFIVTLLICYSVPIAKAKKTRKEIQAGTFKREGGKPGKG